MPGSNPTTLFNTNANTEIKLNAIEVLTSLILELRDQVRLELFDIVKLLHLYYIDKNNSQSIINIHEKNYKKLVNQIGDISLNLRATKSIVENVLSRPSNIIDSLKHAEMLFKFTALPDSCQEDVIQIAQLKLSEKRGELFDNKGKKALKIYSKLINKIKKLEIS